MSYFEDAFLPHVRLTILRLLADAPGYSANDSVLVSATAAIGLPATRDQVRTQIGWLAEQGLVRAEHPTPTLTVAVITERGCDVAAGRGSVQGVQRPSPAP
ncbi:MAG: hypothetical protein ABIS51_18470 [Sphingomonas sp.]